MIAAIHQRIGEHHQLSCADVVCPPQPNTLNEFDVLCGRDKTAFNHTGNRRFRVAVSLHQERYAASNSRKDKSVIIKSVMTMVRMNGGRFLRWKKGILHELSEKESHEKVGHAFRDMVLSSKKTVRSHKPSTVVATVAQPAPTLSIGRVVSPHTVSSETHNLNEPLIQSPPHEQNSLLSIEPANSDMSFEPISLEDVKRRSEPQDPFAIFDEVSVSELARALDTEGTGVMDGEGYGGEDVEEGEEDSFDGDSIDEMMLHWLVGESDEIIQDIQF